MLTADRIAARIAERIRAITIELTVPFKTGELRKSIHTAKHGNSLYIVGTNKKYARAVHEGRPALVIRPRRAKRLKFKAGGKTVFAGAVYQPKRQGKPFFRQAITRFMMQRDTEIKELLPELNKEVAEFLLARLKQQGLRVTK